jgi:hypothetical protein
MLRTPATTAASTTEQNARLGRIENLRDVLSCDTELL